MDHVRAAKQKKRLSEQTVYAAVPGALLSPQEETLMALQVRTEQSVPSRLRLISPFRYP